MYLLEETFPGLRAWAASRTGRALRSGVRESVAILQIFALYPDPLHFTQTPLIVATVQADCGGHLLRDF
jgi:hypothetical protein